MTNATHAKTGILIANLGTPDSTGYWDMRRYLSEFLSDQRVIDSPRWKWQPILQLIVLTKRPFSSGAAYRSIWNNDADESPLLTITRAQSEKLQSAMADRFGNSVLVEFCMRYGNPSTESKLQKLIDAGCTRIVFFPLYPQYAGATTGTANDQLFRALQKIKFQPDLRTIGAYFEHPKFAAALAASITQAYDQLSAKPEVLVASYHGLPQRYIDEGDPYYEHCIATTRAVREQLGWNDGQIVTAFQSKFGPTEWIKPATVDLVADLARQGRKSIAVFAPAFSADCIETLEEINEEIADSFKAAGGEEFTYIACLNAGDDHIDMMADIVADNIQGWV